MHFGNWDAGAAAAVREGLDVTVVADTFGDPRLDREVFGARERLGLKLVSAERLTPSALRCLKRGGLLALLLDKPSPGSGVSVPFFGSCVEVPAGPARIALKSGAAIVPVAFPRTTAGKPLVSALADFNIDATPTGDFETDVHRITAEVMAVHERFIREYPEQWYMFREMWPRPTAGGAP
jgi:KDO2-lipid IV(A) lauroyltransferase